MPRASLNHISTSRASAVRVYPLPLLAWLLPPLWLELVSLLSGTPFSPSRTLLRVLVTLAVLALARWIPGSPPRRRTALVFSLSILSGIAAAWLASRSGPGSSLAVFPALIGFNALLLAGTRFLVTGRPRLVQIILPGISALYAGGLQAIAAQFATRFSEEEFFVALQAVTLAVFWLFLWAAGSITVKAFPGQHRPNPFPRKQAALPSVLVLSGILAATGIFGWFSIRGYQASFFPPAAPEYPGISSETPFVCGQAEESEASVNFTAAETHQLVQRLIEANPNKTPLEYGFLALSSRDPEVAGEFRRSLLAAAEQGKFAGPAQSVKFGQYEAALHLYFYSQVREAFPGLFSEQEAARIRDWFEAINRRALTAEWVDWMYALAFNKMPEGPYENQENGAGLLALLQVTGMADPALSDRNREYLERNRRGWEISFRNTDDAIIYQPEWIYNAIFQAQYRGSASSGNQRLSFDWLLAQALPDGASFGYNHPAPVNLAGIAALGARLLEDPNLAWLAAQAAGHTLEQNSYLFAVPGAEIPFAVEPAAPSLGSCLLFGNSGLPNRPGPLAPDKIIFRDGWQAEDAYLMLNLRFTGWHRYKATNTITLVYQGEPLAGDQSFGRTFSWLPSGRSMFRDKRIPRENLNGLLVPRSGLDAALNTLTGTGSPWAQDPPAYAQVDQFQTGMEYDTATTRITDWHGWEHTRTIRFYHHGPVVVLDTATGPEAAVPALAWHAFGEASGRIAEGRFQLGDGEQQAELVLLPLDGGIISSSAEENGIQVLFQPEQAGNLRTASLFLTNDWWGAEVRLVDGGQNLQISLPDRILTIPLTEVQ